ncbi:hypothetical protein T03_15823 [Trichinella britovi]|uniref:Uncharacterized protein n=1 Tax=Trichinella britovi TaxID=45882 RepID=A0A0V1A815_TRIBR|nr:hypothetical protein T03_15823 [Trichinella britovi]
MGLVPKPRYSMYWSTELRCDAIVDARWLTEKAHAMIDFSKYDL